VLAALPAALALLGTVSMAYAIAHAPNGLTSVQTGNDDPPESLEGHGSTTALTVPVGPPRASLSTWVVEPRSEPRGTVVLLHGVRLDKHSMVPLATALVDHGYRSVLIDLRGHGRSTGDYLTYGLNESRDVSQVLDALEVNGTRLGPVGALGFSYGGATALFVAERDPRVRAVVAVSTFASLRGVVRDYVRWQAPRFEPVVPNVWLDTGVDLGARWAGFDADAASPAAAASRSNAALLLLHGADDPQVSADNARIIERAAGGRAELVLLSGQTHASVLADATGTVREAAIRWFDARLGE